MTITSDGKVMNLFENEPPTYAEFREHMNQISYEGKGYDEKIVVENCGG